MQDKNAESVRIIQIQVNLVGRQETLPDVTTKINPLSSAQFQRIGYTTSSVQVWGTHNKFGLNHGSSVISDDYADDHILSEEDMFTEKIEPIISNGVSIIGVKCVIPIGVVTFIWSFTDD